MLIHVEIPLEDSLLEGIRYLDRLGHLSSGRLHNRHALSTMMLSGRAWNRVSTRNGGAFSAGTEILHEVEAFTIGVPNVPIARPHIPEGTRSEAQTPCKRRVGDT